MSIARYSFWSDEFTSQTVDGPWVKYDDHVKAIADLYDENTQLRIKLAMNERVQATLDEVRSKPPTFILAQEPGFQPFRD